MEHRRCFLRLITFACVFLTIACKAQHGPSIQAAIANLHTFSEKLLAKSDLEFAKFAQGVVSSVPFSVGYMLANINALKKQISSSRNEKSSQENVVNDYSTLLELLNISNFTTSSGVFLKENDSSTAMLKLSEDFKKLKTEIRNLQSSSEAKKVSPPEAFPFTTSILRNSNIYKGQWNKKWTSIGNKKFSDGASVSFLEMEGPVPILERANFTAVALKIMDERKYLVLILPKENASAEFHQLLSWEAGYPDERWSKERIRNIQVPVLDLTVYLPFWNFDDVGIPTDACSYTIKGSDEQLAENSEPLQFSSPVVQINRLVINSDVFEVESETEGAVYSVASFTQFLNEKGGLTGFIKLLNEAFNMTADKSNQNKWPDRVEDVKERQRRSPSLTTDTLQFNRPFYWYLVDEMLGPLYSGAVESLETYRRDAQMAGGLQKLLMQRKFSALFCPQLFSKLLQQNATNTFI